MENTVGQTIWKININKVVNAKSYLCKSGVFIDEHKIIGISRYKICINDDWFSTFSFTEKGKRKESYNHYFDDTIISIRTKETYFGNGVFIKMFSTKKPTTKILIKMVAEASIKIDKEYGFLFSGVKGELYNYAESYKL